MRQRHRVATVCGLFLSLAFASFGAEPPGPVTGAVKLSSGRTASYAIHFDRNSIRASVRFGDHLIAATSSGALLRFDLPGLRLMRERVDPEPITCLGTGEGGAIVAGYRDGRIVGVDPATLDVREMFRVTDEPQWIGWAPAVNGRKAGLVVASRRAESRPRKTVLQDLAGGKTIVVEDHATAFLLDRQGRLWLGSDHGEWGGRISRVDLASGKVEAVKPPPERDARFSPSWEGIYGFLERRDGQVWVFGGTIHFGCSSYVARADVDDPRILFRRKYHDVEGKAPEIPPPCLPITHMVEEKGELRVFSYDNAFRVDAGLRDWARAGTLEIAYRWGRPDSLGSYPSVVAVHPPARPGEPWGLATLADGYVTLDGTKAVPHALPGQLGASGVYGMEQTQEGLLCFDSEVEASPWKLGPKGWETVSLSPLFEVEPNGDPDVMAQEKEEGRWNRTIAFFGPGGEIVTLSDTYLDNGTLATARRVNGRSERIGLERTMKDPWHCFITGNGTIWNSSGVRINRFEAGRWKLVTENREGLNVSSVRVIGKHGPPWVLFEHDEKTLWRLDHDSRGENPRMARVDLRETSQPLRVEAAIPWAGRPGSVLLATDAGLRAYDPTGGTLAKVALPDPPRPVLAMARDGLGRLWVVSKHGLRMFEPVSKVTETFERVPGIGRPTVTSLAADPQHADGVVVGLGERGVAFVRVPPP